jgi:hypothetical protein
MTSPSIPGGKGRESRWTKGERDGRADHPGRSARSLRQSWRTHRQDRVDPPTYLEEGILYALSRTMRSKRERQAYRSYWFSQRRMNPSRPWGMKMTMPMKMSPSGIR